MTTMWNSPCKVVYDSQEETDNLQYEIINDGTKKIEHQGKREI